MLKDFNYKIIEIKTTGVVKQLLMLPISTRNNFINYTSGNGQSLTLYDGYSIIRENGFNFNLVSLESEKYKY